MEAHLFNILHLPPGRYSRKRIDQQYRRVRTQILRTGGPDQQRRLDDALIAHAMLTDPTRQASLVKRISRSTVDRPARKPMPVPTAPVAGHHRPIRPASRARGTQVAPPSDLTQFNRFARMVADHVEGGILRLTARQRLLKRAEGLGIAPFKANLIIAEVLYDLAAGREPMATVGADGLTAPSAKASPPIPYGLRLAAAVAVAAALDLLLMAWLG